VNRSTLHALDTIVEVALESGGDLAGRFVGEGEDANPGRLDREVLDQKADALDETEGFAGARTGEDEQRLRRGFNRRAL
jgi:hypothetical protein